MKAKNLYTAFFLSVLLYSSAVYANEAATEKPSPEKVVQILKDGNARFVQGKSTHPDCGLDRIALANKESQGKYAYATILSCSDSRVPLELLFDTGIMDIFVVRVAGNVCNTDETGSIEYGLAHVNTPLLLILGHSQCGAVTAVTEAVKGHGHKMEKNIPTLVSSIIPAVKKSISENPKAEGAELLNLCVEENVYQSFENLFMKSAAVRELVKTGKVKAVGAVYDLSTGKVNWLPDEKISQILEKVEKNPAKELNKFAEEH